MTFRASAKSCPGFRAENPTRVPRERQTDRLWGLPRCGRACTSPSMRSVSRTAVRPCNGGARLVVAGLAFGGERGSLPRTVCVAGTAPEGCRGLRGACRRHVAARARAERRAAFGGRGGSSTSPTAEREPRDSSMLAGPTLPRNADPATPQCWPPQCWLRKPVRAAPPVELSLVQPRNDGPDASSDATQTGPDGVPKSSFLLQPRKRAPPHPLRAPPNHILAGHRSLCSWFEAGKASSTPLGARPNHILAGHRSLCSWFEAGKASSTPPRSASKPHLGRAPKPLLVVRSRKSGPGTTSALVATRV